MEALFSIFHIGDVGVGVMGRWRSCYLVGRGCVYGFTVQEVLPVYNRIRKKKKNKFVGPRPIDCHLEPIALVAGSLSHACMACGGGPGGWRELFMQHKIMTKIKKRRVPDPPDVLPVGFLSPRK